MRHVILSFALVASAAPAMAQQPAPEERKRIMQEMMSAAQPGPEHQRLARLAGTWDVSFQMFSHGGGPSMNAKGVAENRMILGGRFLESRMVAGEDPMKMEALVLYGFDRRHAKYTTVGYDTGGTYYVTAAGTWADSSRAITLSGTDDDPIAKHTQVYDMHLRIVDDDTYVTDVVFTDAAHTGGKGPFKAFEATFRRRQ